MSRDAGEMFGTVGDIIDEMDGVTPQAPAPITRLVPPTLEGTPAMPEPGIYFGMSDEDYHAVPALSFSGIKKLAASPMIFWAATPWLSEKKRKDIEEAKESDDKPHFIFGKAYHCRIMEGTDAYASRYAVELDPADFPDALVKTAQIQAAIARHTQMQPVKPQGNKPDLLIQLRRLAGCEVADAEGRLFLDGEKVTVEALKTRIGLYEEEAPVVPVRKVEDFMPDSGDSYMRDAVKADWIKQLLTLEPEAQIFDVLAEQHRAAHPGKVFLSADRHYELEIAAAMVARDPELQHAFKGGQPEVSLFWYCPKTGVPMKARVDYLKIKAMVDLKSIGNVRQRSMEQAIRFEIASYHYNLQPAVYFEGAEVVRALVREHQETVIHHCDIDVNEDQVATDARDAWCHRWAAHTQPDEWLWVFQQKGDAPITRGVWFPRGTVMMISQDIVLAAKKRFREYAETFGTSPWLDVKPTYLIADEEIPNSATEI